MTDENNHSGYRRGFITGMAATVVLFGIVRVAHWVERVGTFDALIFILNQPRFSIGDLVTVALVVLIGLVILVSPSIMPRVGK